MTKKEIITAFVNQNINATIEEIVAACDVSKSTVYKYIKEIKAEIEANEKVADEKEADEKSFSTSIQKGYSRKQMAMIYSHCKNHDLFIAAPVLKLMYSWADKYNVKEADPVMEDLRNCACKLVKCVSLSNFAVAQKKARYIESVLKKMDAPKAA